MKKKKCLDLGPGIPYLGIFDPKCLIWVFLNKNFRKAIVIFEINTIKFGKNKMPKFETTNA